MDDRRSSLRQVFRHALVFGLAPLLQKIASVVLLPLYTHHLSRQDYGEVELLVMASGLVALVLRFELRPALIRAWTVATPEERPRILSGVAVPVAVAALIGAIALAATQAQWSTLLLGTAIAPALAFLLAVMVLCDVAVLPFSAVLQAQLHSSIIVSVGLAQFIVGTSVSIVGVVVLGAGPIGVIAGSTAASVLGLLATVWHYARHFGFAAPNWGVLSPILRYSWPLLLAAVMFFVVRNGDRYLLSQLLSVADLGLYAVTWSLANLLGTIVVGPILTSVDVWRYRLHEQANGAQEFADVFRVAMAVVCVAAVGVSTVVTEVFALAADSSYTPAARYVPILATAVAVQAGYSIVASAFFVTGTTGRWTLFFAAAAATQVTASIALIPLLGIAGAALGTTIANSLLYACAALVGRRLWDVPFDHLRATAALLVIPIASAIHVWSMPMGVVARVALDLLLIAGAAVCMHSLGMVRLSELINLRRRLSARQ